MQNTQEMEFSNQNYMQLYCKVFKRWNFKTKITGRNISKLLRGGVCKTKVRSKISQNPLEVIRIGRNIPKFSRDGIYKPGLKAKILQNSK